MPSKFRFGPFELSTDTGELRRNGIRIKLFGQPIKVLTLLVTTPGQVVTREQLQKSLWPGDTFGDFERGLNAAVNRLRENLGDSAAEPTYVETVPGRGYRFIGGIQTDGSKPLHLEADPSLGQAVGSQNCTLIAFTPKESAVGRAAELVAWLRHGPSEENDAGRITKAESAPLGGIFYERSFELEFIPNKTGDFLNLADVVLRLNAPNFEPDQQLKELHVPPGLDSSPCTFLIKPSLPGELVANLELLSESGKVVASRSIRTRALRLSDDDFRSGLSVSFAPPKDAYEHLRKEARTSPAVEQVQPAIEHQTRLLEAAAPKEATVGRSIEVIATVREGDSQGGLRTLLLLETASGLDEGDVRERPFEMEFPLDADGKPQPLSISLRLESPGFEPSSQIKKLRVPPIRSSPICTFLVIPRLVGEHVLNLELLDPDQQVLVSRSIRTKALPSGVESGPDRTLVTIPLPVVIHSRAVENSKGEPETELQASPHREIRAPGFRGSAENLTTDQLSTLRKLVIG